MCSAASRDLDHDDRAGAIINSFQAPNNVGTGFSSRSLKPCVVPTWSHGPDKGDIGGVPRLKMISAGWHMEDDSNAQNMVDGQSIPTAKCLPDVAAALHAYLKGGSNT